MRKKFYLGIALIGIGLVSLTTILYRATIADSSQASREVATSSLAASSALTMRQSYSFATMAIPKRILIPALDVDTDVLEVGVTAAGNMAVPKSFSKTGWYKYGAIPGNDGSAVIAGHVDNGLRLAGVFKHLGDIQIGNVISIVDEKGATSTFQVIATSSIGYQDADTKDIFATSGFPMLRLITCEGEWIQADKTYSQRLIVTALRVE